MSLKNYITKKLKLDEAYYQFLCCSYYMYLADSNCFKSFEDFCNDFKDCLKNKEYLTNVDKPYDFYYLGGSKK